MGGQSKVKKLMIFLLSACLISASCASKFGYPVEGEGWYSIQAGFSTGDHLENGSWEITKVSVNGKRVRDFLLFKERKEAFDKIIVAPSSFRLKIRYGWEGDKEYDIKTELKNRETGKTASLDKKMMSPSRAGYWDPRWKNYLSLLISEENGYKRMNYPVQATVGILSEYFHSPPEKGRISPTQKSLIRSTTLFPGQIPSS